MTLVKIDDKDRAIIKELQLNARQPASQIAKKTGLPHDVVKYRIKKLEHNKVIRHYKAVIDPSVLGYELYVYVGFSLLSIAPEDEKKFISYLKEVKNITYVAKNSGKWDFSIGICAKNYIEFDKILSTIRRKFAPIIKDFDASPVIESYKYDWISDLI